MTQRFAVLFVLTALPVVSSKGLSPLLSKVAAITANIFEPLDDPSIYYNSEELIRASGYPSEAHRVTTEDGYILQVHRIPNNGDRETQKLRPKRSLYKLPHGLQGKPGKGKKKNQYKFHHGVQGNFTGKPGKGTKKNLYKSSENCSSQETFKEKPGKRTKRMPVFLQHGLTAASDCWLMQGPQRDLAYLLSDAGYDVWLGNARGNYYSRAHVNISREDPKFWDYSMEEMGNYDLPSVIDYILNATNSKQLHYVGHSMGTTMFFVMAAVKPEYIRKIRTFNGLGPIATLNEPKMPAPKKTIMKTGRMLMDSFRQHNINEILPRVNWLPMLANAFCKESSAFQTMCSDITFFFLGTQSKLISKKRLVSMLSHGPSGASLKTITHYLQMIRSARFQRYDYGIDENLVRYGEVVPTRYNLTSLTCPVSLHYSEGDHLVDHESVELLMQDIPKVVYANKLTRYNHIDFLWAMNANKELYPKVMEIIQRYEPYDKQFVSFTSSDQHL